MNNKTIIKKISSTKNNLRYIKSNQLAVTCNLSHTSVAVGKGICLHILNNNSKYISSEYLKHKIFDDFIKISISTRLDMLTCVYYGATLTRYLNNNKVVTLKTNNFDFAKMPTYKIIFKNGLELEIYDNDAKAKKYFNVLKYIKSSIYEIYFYTHGKMIKINDINEYPPYAKKMYEYLYYGGYNPSNKRDCIRVW